MHVIDGSLYSVEVVAVNLYVMQQNLAAWPPQDYKRLSIVHFSECQRNGLLCLPAIVLVLTNVKAKGDLSKLKPVKASSIP